MYLALLSLFEVELKPTMLLERDVSFCTIVVNT